jgi:hypothetical protein
MSIIMHWQRCLEVYTVVTMHFHPFFGIKHRFDLNVATSTATRSHRRNYINIQHPFSNVELGRIPKYLQTERYFLIKFRSSPEKQGKKRGMLRRCSPQTSTDRPREPGSLWNAPGIQVVNWKRNNKIAREGSPVVLLPLCYIWLIDRDNVCLSRTTRSAMGRCYQKTACICRQNNTLCEMLFVELPEDVLREVLEYVPVEGLVAFEQTCRFARQLVLPMLWGNMFVNAEPTPSYCQPLPRYIDSEEEGLFYLDEMNLSKRFINVSHPESMDKFFRALVEEDNAAVLEGLTHVQAVTVYINPFIEKMPVKMNGDVDLEEVRSHDSLQLNWIFQYVIPLFCTGLRRLDLEVTVKETRSQKITHFLADLLSQKFVGVEKNFKFIIDGWMDFVSFYKMISDGTCRLLHVFYDYSSYPLISELVESCSLPESIVRFEIGCSSLPDHRFRPSRVANEKFKQFLSTAPKLKALSISRLAFLSNEINWVPESVDHLHLFENTDTKPSAITSSPPTIQNVTSLDTLLAANCDTFEKLNLPNLQRLNFYRTTGADFDGCTSNLFKHSRHIQQLQCKFMTYSQTASIVRACGSTLTSLNLESVTHPGPSIDQRVVELIDSLKNTNLHFLKLPLPRYYGLSQGDLIKRIITACPQLQCCYLEGSGLGAPYLTPVKNTPHYTTDSFSKILLDSALLFKLDVQKFVDIHSGASVHHHSRLLDCIRED